MSYPTKRHIRIPGTRLQVVSSVLTTAIMLAILSATGSTQAQTFTVLHSFTGDATDGGFPVAGLIRDAAGNLYGTTDRGGPVQAGTVFKIDHTGEETVLYSFTGGADGGGVTGGLIRASGNLYGTTIAGGTFNCGTVFMIDKKGKETVLYSFTGKTDGYGPFAGLVRDPAGNLYGTTNGGGAMQDCGGGGCGVVFMLDATGKETVLYSFIGGSDGANLEAGLIRDFAGNLYGIVSGGGDLNCNAPYGCGLVFKLDTTGNKTILYTFTGGTDGGLPASGMIRDSAGNLYGTLYIGSTHQAAGAIFKIDRKGKETVLYNFTGGADGGFSYGGLVRDSVGDLYGTTNAFGASGFGTVFKLDPLGSLTVLHAFTGGADGGYPYAGPLRDTAGNLYGTTSYGGSDLVGTVFEITP